MSKPLLFCVPYAGGSATVYLRWRRFLSDLVDVVPVELAGRGMRLQEPVLTNARAHGEDVAATIASHLAEGGERDFIVWGHSMGTLVAYEAYYALKRRHESGTGPRVASLPAHMVFSGRTPPHIDVTRTEYHRLGDDEFIDAVDTYGGGTAASLRSSNELRELFLPILRADFAVSETYEWSDPGATIDSAVTVLNGADDSTITHSHLDGWRDLTRSPIVDRRVPGGHFLVFEQDDLVRGTVQAAVNALRAQTHSTTGKALS